MIPAMWVMVAVLTSGANTYSILNLPNEASCEIVRRQMIEKMHLENVACIYVPSLAIPGAEPHDHEHK